VAEVEDVGAAEEEEGDVASSIIQFMTTLTTPLFSLSAHTRLIFFTKLTCSYNIMYFPCAYTLVIINTLFLSII
jgi:hypothetical protein